MIASERVSELKSVWRSYHRDPELGLHSWELLVKSGREDPDGFRRRYGFAPPTSEEVAELRAKAAK